MSSVARCYTPLKTNVYIKSRDHYGMRRDSFEIGVFEASNYYSSIMESTFENDNDVDCAQNEGNDDHSAKKRSINVVPSFKHDKPNKNKNNNKHKKFMPSSPGAKLRNYLHSMLNQTLVSKPKTNKPILFEDDRKSSRSSSMSLARCLDMAEVASVRSCPSYTSYDTRRPPTTPISSAQGRAVHLKPGYKDLRSYSSFSSKQNLVDAETLMADKRSWPALTWFDQELKIRKEVSLSYNVKGLKKVKEEDSYESDSSSDLFELRKSDLKVQGGLGELPVHKTTMSSIKPRK